MTSRGPVMPGEGALLVPSPREHIPRPGPSPCGLGVAVRGLLPPSSMSAGRGEGPVPWVSRLAPKGSAVFSAGWLKDPPTPQTHTQLGRVSNMTPLTNEEFLSSPDKNAA